MGNTWARYRSLQADTFEREFFAFPRSITRKSWRQALELVRERRVEVVLARQVESAIAGALASGQLGAGQPPDMEQYSSRMAAALRPSVERSVAIEMSEFEPEEEDPGDEPEGEPEGEPERAPDDEALLSLESMRGGRSILACCSCSCGVELAESDIIHDLWCDFPPVGAPGSPARAAFDAFLGVLGYPGSPSELPWWVSKAYPPGDHYAGLASPAQLADFAKLAGHAGLREALRAAILGRWGREQPRFDRVLDFIERAAASSRWLLSIESAY